MQKSYKGRIHSAQNCTFFWEGKCTLYLPSAHICIHLRYHSLPYSSSSAHLPHAACCISFVSTIEWHSCQLRQCSGSRGAFESDANGHSEQMLCLIMQFLPWTLRNKLSFSVVVSFIGLLSCAVEEANGTYSKFQIEPNMLLASNSEISLLTT